MPSALAIAVAAAADDRCSLISAAGISSRDVMALSFRSIGLLCRPFGKFVWRHGHGSEVALRTGPNSKSAPLFGRVASHAISEAITGVLLRR